MKLKKIGETKDKKENILAPNGDPNKGIYYAEKEDMIMNLWIDKQELLWLLEMQNEGRTRSIKFSTFRTKSDDSEIELEVKEAGR